MMQPLISVIVPVYNVEPYLKECLDSVVGQTYRNLEIILVNDGSTDKSGELCDEYAAKDGRVRVIHQPNGGVAAARNAGLGAVTGDYIAWADSDDVCAPDMVEYLYEGLAAQGAQMSQCGVTTNRVVFDCAQMARSGGKTVVLSAVAEIFDAFLKNEIWHNLTFKLYAARLFDGVTFPNLKFGEDSWVQYSFLGKMKRIVLLPDVKYYYRQRAGSLMHSYTMEDCVVTYQSLHQVLFTKLGDLPPHAEGRFAYILTHCYAIMLARTDKSQLPEKAQLDALFSFIRSMRRSILTCPLVGPLGRLEVLAVCSGRPWSWRFAAWCQKVFEYRAERGNRARADHKTGL